MDAYFGATLPVPSSSLKPKSSWQQDPIRSPRRASWRGGRSSTQGVSCQTPSQSSSEKEIPIWLSVFFGDLDPVVPQLDHARFDANINGQVFEHRDIRGCNENLSRPPESSTLRLLPRQRRLSQDIAALEGIIRLARSFTDEILTCVTEGCAVCHTERAKSLVHRPLSATRSGYFDLPDFSQTGRLMSIIASHTAHITEKAEIDWSIGNVANERPYVCTLAVPICSPDGECSRVAIQRLQTYVSDILGGKVKPNPAATRFGISERATEVVAERKSFTSSTSSEKARSDSFGDLSLPGSSFMASGVGCTKLCSIGMTVFVGKPSLQVDAPPIRGQLSCLVYSSSWPELLLPCASKNEADDAIDYCRIVASHEKLVLESASYGCAVCSQPVPAESLVHRPLAFVRVNAQESLNGPVRQLIMKLFQFVRGRWNSSAVNSALGSGSDAHIFDFVVPICKGRAVCEEIGRAAAQEFISLLLPSEMRLIFPGLDPDTDLKVFENLFEDEFEWEPRSPQLLVFKSATEGLIADGHAEEESHNCSSTISKLRQWYELHFSAEIAKQRHSASFEGVHPPDPSDSDSSTESEIDESMIWVYTRGDLMDGAAPNDVQSTGPPRSGSNLAKKMEQLILFQPLMSFDFWLVNEALETISQPSATITEFAEFTEGDDYSNVEASSRYSGDTEIWQKDVPV